MGRTVEDVALLDAIMSGSPLPLKAKSLEGLRMGIPASFWTDLDSELKTAVDAAKKTLIAAGVVMVDVDIDGLMVLNSKCSFPIIWPDRIECLEAYLQFCSPATTVKNVVDQLASPDVKMLFADAVMSDDNNKNLHHEAITIHRPALRTLYEEYFTNNQLDAILFPTTIVPAPIIDTINGSSLLKVLIRNTDPGSNACIPGLTVPAGLTSTGLPVGLAIDGPRGSDRTLLRIGMSIETLLGTLPVPNL